MTRLPGLAALFVVPNMRFGALRLTPYGVCAAVGLVSGMALSRAAARKRALDPEVVWDAGVVAIVGCLIASRLLLVVRDPKAFLHYPLLVLSLPSLTFGGMALAAVLLGLYLRRLHLPVLAVLDVFAVPGALLAAVLEFGHWLDGSEVGMPSSLPWAVQDPWAPQLLRVHPVSVYGVLASAVIGLVLWGCLRAWARPGAVAALGLLLGGALAFGLDMLTQPLLSLDQPRLEPGQWVALAVMLAGALLWVFAPQAAKTRPAPTQDPQQPNRDPEGSGQMNELQTEMR